MDDLIKLLQNLMANKPRPKGGIADTPQGVEFLGTKLTKKQLQEYELINTKITDPSVLNAISLRNVGRDARYMHMRDFNEDFTNDFETVIQFLKDNPDIRLTQAQKDNVIYNLGVYRRVNSEKAKLEKGIIEQGKDLEEIYKKANEDRPLEQLSFTQALERILKLSDDIKTKAKETDDIFSTEVSPERQLRIKRLYDGPGYDNPNSSVFRGLGSRYLPMLHDKGIIKLDDQIYQNLKQGKHHWGGAMYNAPDPVRIWRYHFGNDVFDKMDKWNYNSDDVFKWIEQNNIQPIKREGPSNALEYLTPTEIQQNLTDELSFFNKYKNPEKLDENSKQFYFADKPKQRMERITYHGENVQALENTLQKSDPDSYKEYYRTNKAVQEGAQVIPFKKDEGILAVKSGAEAEGMLKDFLQKSDQLSGANVKPIKEGQTPTKLDTLPMRLIKNFNTDYRLKDLLNEGYSKEQADVLIKAKNKITSGEEMNPNEALLRVKEEMADEAGVDVDELDFDFQIEKPEPIDEFAKGGVVSNRKGFQRGGMGLLGLLGGITPYQEDVIPDVDFFSGITDDDIYNEYDEKEGYTSIFKKGFTTKDGKEIEIPYRPDRGIDIGGLLEVFDRTDLGTPPGDDRSKRIKEYDI
jgi:hypothetical protein